MPGNAKKPSTETYLIGFREMASIYDDSAADLRWPSPFVLPFWLEGWWRVFGENAGLLILLIRSNGAYSGIAPLMAHGKTARFIGSENLCDYLDMVTAAGQDDAFYSALFAFLAERGFSKAELGPVREDSTVYSALSGMSRYSGHGIAREQAGAFCEFNLPHTWEAYLEVLDGKQRHEIRRKMRRLEEAGQIDLQVVRAPEAVVPRIKEFLTLFQVSRWDKAAFLTPQVKTFFEAAIEKMAQRRMLALYVLTVNRVTAAVTVCFDYGDALSLYNNGYHPDFGHLSAGTISKVMSIRDAISNGKRRFDFMQGSEDYKKRLGGREKPLYRFFVELRK